MVQSFAFGQVNAVPWHSPASQFTTQGMPSGQLIVLGSPTASMMQTPLLSQLLHALGHSQTVSEVSVHADARSGSTPLHVLHVAQAETKSSTVEKVLPPTQSSQTVSVPVITEVPDTQVVVTPLPLPQVEQSTIVVSVPIFELSPASHTAATNFVVFAGSPQAASWVSLPSWEGSPATQTAVT